MVKNINVYMSHYSIARSACLLLKIKKSSALGDFYTMN